MTREEILALLGQILEFYMKLLLICLDAGYLSRENVEAMEKIHSVPRIFPKKGVTLKAKGLHAWKNTLLEFLEDAQRTGCGSTTGGRS